MAMHLRSACAPPLLTIALAVFLLLGVHDLERHKIFMRRGWAKAHDNYVVV